MMIVYNMLHKHQLTRLIAIAGCVYVSIRLKLSYLSSHCRDRRFSGVNKQCRWSRTRDGEELRLRVVDNSHRCDNNANNSCGDQVRDVQKRILGRNARFWTFGVEVGSSSSFGSNLMRAHASLRNYTAFLLEVSEPRQDEKPENDSDRVGTKTPHHG